MSVSSRDGFFGKPCGYLAKIDDLACVSQLASQNKFGKHDSYPTTTTTDSCESACTRFCNHSHSTLVYMWPSVLRTPTQLAITIHNKPSALSPARRRRVLNPPDPNRTRGKINNKTSANHTAHAWRLEIAAHSRNPLRFHTSHIIISQWLWRRCLLRVRRVCANCKRWSVVVKVVVLFSWCCVSNPPPFSAHVQRSWHHCRLHSSHTIARPN